MRDIFRRSSWAAAARWFGTVSVVIMIGYWYSRICAATYSCAQTAGRLLPRRCFHQRQVRAKASMMVTGCFSDLRPPWRRLRRRVGLSPFECPYNERRTLRLEDGGKAYMIDKKAAHSRRVTSSPTVNGRTTRAIIGNRSSNLD